MPTYRLSARNQFRSPSGAVGEAPDGPGALAALSDDLDNRLGVGGAEYCANFAAITALPSSRCFIGKLAFNATNGNVYRYTGTTWQPYEGTFPWTPTWTNLTIGSGSSVVAAAALASGIIGAISVKVGTGTGFALASGTADVSCSLPTELQGTTFGWMGVGAYALAGNSTPLGLLVESANNALRIRVGVGGTPPLYKALTTTNIAGTAVGDSIRFTASGAFV